MEAAAKASAVIPDAAPTVTEEIDDDVTRAVADAERARRVAAGTAAGAIAASGPAAESGASVGEDRIAAAAAQTTELLGRFRPGQEHAPAEVGPAAVHPDEQPVRETHLAAETVESPPVVSLSAAAIAADEAVEAIRRAAIESGPAVEPTIEPPTAQPVAAASEPAAQPAVEPLPGVAAEPGPAAPEPAPIPTPSRDDRVEAPVWQIVAPETADTTSGATPIPTPQPVESPRPSAQRRPDQRGRPERLRDRAAVADTGDHATTTVADAREPTEPAVADPRGRHPGRHRHVGGVEPGRPQPTRFRGLRLRELWPPAVGRRPVLSTLRVVPALTSRRSRRIPRSPAQSARRAEAITPRRCTQAAPSRMAWVTNESQIIAAKTATNAP